MITPGSFNPSVGILFIQAADIETKIRRTQPFQSLGRDSVHSSCGALLIAFLTAPFQSLGRDSVHSSPGGFFGLLRPWGFQSLGRDSVHSSG